MSVKKITTSDKISRPFEVSKHWSFDSRLVEYPILREDGSNVNIEGDDVDCPTFLALESQYPFSQIKVSHGVKSNGVFFDTGSSLYDSNDNPVNLNGSYKRSIYDFVYRNFYDSSYGVFNLSGIETIDRGVNGDFIEERNIGDSVVLLDISPGEFGEKILPNTVSLTGYREGNKVFTIADDGHTNLRYVDKSIPISTLNPSHEDFVDGYQPINDRFGQYIKSYGGYVLISIPSDEMSFNDPKAGTVQLFKWDGIDKDYRFVKEFYVPDNQNSVTRELSIDNDHLIGLEQGGFILTGNAPFPYTSLQDDFGSALDIGDQFAVIGSPGDNTCDVGPSGSEDPGFQNAGMVYIYDKYKGGTDNWGLINVLQADRGDRFGESVAIHGDTIVIGAPGVSGSGAVYVYRRKIFMDDDACMSWVTSSFYQVLKPEWDFENGSYTSSLCSNLINESSSLYDLYDLYEEQDTPYFIAGNNTFILEQILSPTDTNDTEFGISVDIYNTDIVVGTGNDSVYVFYKNFDFDHHGVYLRVDGEEAVYFQPDEDDEDEFLYMRSGVVDICAPGSWEQSCRFDRHVTSDNSPDIISYNETSSFGASVSINKDFLAIGVPYDKTFKQYVSSSNTFSAGSVYIYQKNYTSCGTEDCEDGCPYESDCKWTFTQRLIPRVNTNLNYTFGHSLDLNRQYLVVGSRNKDSISGSLLPNDVIEFEGALDNDSNGNAYLYKFDKDTKKFESVNEFEYRNPIGDIPRIYGSSVTLNDSHVFVGAPAIISNIADVLTAYASSSGTFYYSPDNGSVYVSYNTGSFTQTSSLAASFSGSTFVYDIEDTSVVGNVFYKNGSIVVTDENPFVIDTLIGSGDVDFRIDCDSKFTIFENEYIISVSPGEFNTSQNPTSLINEKIDFDVNADGKFDVADLDIIMRYINKYKLLVDFDDYSDNAIVTEQDLHTNPGELSESEFIKRNIKNHPDDESWWNNDVILLESNDVLVLEQASETSFKQFTDNTERLNSTYINRCRTLEAAGKLDFNGDGVVDENDANILLLYFLGKYVDMTFGTIPKNSTRKFSKDIVEFIDQYTGRRNGRIVHPNFYNYIESSSYDKTGSYLSPFVTGIGLYDDEYNLIAVAKLAKPIKILQNYPINFKVSFDS